MYYLDLKEDYLDKDKKFYDYHTKSFDGKNPFDINRGESAFVRQLLNDPDYMADYKNLKSEIIQMTPLEYFEGCAEIFNSSVDRQINQIKNDKQTLEHLEQVLNVYNRTFPITYLNYAEKGQEGRHRMYVVGQLFGWNKKFPVLVITWNDPDLARKKEEKEAEYQKNKILDNINWAVDHVKNFYVTDVDMFKDELQDILERKFYPDDISIVIADNDITITVKNISKSFSLYSLNIQEFDNEF